MKRDAEGIMAALVLAVLLSFFGAVCLAQTRDEHKTTKLCQLISANPPDFNLFQFVPKEVDFKGLNRSPKVSYVVHEDGSVSNVKILKGTGSGKVDAGLVKSIQAWKYKPQPGGCNRCLVMRSQAIGFSNRHTHTATWTYPKSENYRAMEDVIFSLNVSSRPHRFVADA
jgi:TonB family protein